MIFETRDGQVEAPPKPGFTPGVHGQVFADPTEVMRPLYPERRPAGYDL